jgi:hypothetical protein
MRDQLRVRSEPLTFDGVKTYVLTPEVIPPENCNRLLIHVHGGTPRFEMVRGHQAGVVPTSGLALGAAL